MPSSEFSMCTERMPRAGQKNMLLLYFGAKARIFIRGCRLNRSAQRVGRSSALSSAMIMKSGCECPSTCAISGSSLISPITSMSGFSEIVASTNSRMSRGRLAIKRDFLSMKCSQHKARGKNVRLTLGKNKDQICPLGSNEGSSDQLGTDRQGEL